MASPFQQQARQRKLLYIGLILVLFTVAWGWRRQVIDGQAEALAIREESRGEVELTGAVVRLGLTGSRGLVTSGLWIIAMDKQKKNQWNELEVIVRSLTKLQPHFITPWIFQSWNLSYNVSVESDRLRDKYFYITRGIELLAEGDRQNRNHPDIRWSIGFFLYHKISISDDTNYLRSLFQLSLIPPNERDPARFWKTNDKGVVELNMEEFKEFCKKHPQLVRRLRNAIQRDRREKKKLFTCPTPEEAVQFLEDNQQVPSLYKSSIDTSRPAQSRSWEPTKKDELLTVEQRFPVLPQRHQGTLDEALDDESPMGDDIDANAIAHSWFCYAQEPLPKPGKWPGIPEEITDRARQRRPKNMTTLIFRNYPAQGRRFMAERLQQEGWFDDEGWDCGSWFVRGKDVTVGEEFIIGKEREWSRIAWQKAFDAWEDHGKVNHLLFPSLAEERRMEKLSAEFASRFRLQPNGMPPPMRRDNLSAEVQEQYDAARYMFEYTFYRNVSNFAHHYNRAAVERKRETIAARKYFFLAEELYFLSKYDRAYELYLTPVTRGWEDAKLSPDAPAYYIRFPIENPRWKSDKSLPRYMDVTGTRMSVNDPPRVNGKLSLTPMEAWCNLVMMKNDDFRNDSFNKELTAEFQIQFLRVKNRASGETDRPAGSQFKKRVAAAAALVPLLPKTDPNQFQEPIVPGPFEVKDAQGKLLLDDATIDVIQGRNNLPTRRIIAAPPPAPPGVVGPGTKSDPRSK